MLDSFREACGQPSLGEGIRHTTLNRQPYTGARLRENRHGRRDQRKRRQSRSSLFMSRTGDKTSVGADPNVHRVVLMVKIESTVGLVAIPDPFRDPGVAVIASLLCAQNLHVALLPWRQRKGHSRLDAC